MAGFALGVVVGLFVGGFLGQLRSAARGKRSDYVKAKGLMPGLKKSSQAALTRYFGYLAITALMVGALLVGLSRGSTS